MRREKIILNFIKNKNKNTFPTKYKHNHGLRSCNSEHVKKAFSTPKSVIQSFLFAFWFCNSVSTN